MQSHPMNVRRWSLATAVLALATTLTACDKHDDQTAGQKLDQAVEQTKDGAQHVGAAASAMVDSAQQAASDAATSVSDAAVDLSITTKLKAALTQDSQLSALKIDVDTHDGRVALTGTAPDATARDRAATLASQIEGVKSVDNRLTVEAKG